MKQLGKMSSLWSTGRYENVLKRGAWLRYLPWMVLLFMLAGSWQLWKSAERHALEERQVEFDLRVQGAVDRIKQRMQEYEQVLYGTRGFFIHQQEIEHREFYGYIESLKLAQRFPGIQGVSYAPLVLAPRKQAHIAAVRKDGMADYTIQPEGTREQYAPVAYIEPHEGRNQRALGFDNFSSPQRRASLEKARDLNQAIVSEKLTLMQEDGQVAQPGCLMFLPVYKKGVPHETLAERRANIAGWLAASFRMNELIAGILARDTDELDIEIYDGSEASEPSLLFDSDNHASRGQEHLFETFTQVEIAGHPWRITAHSLPIFDAGVDKSKAYLTALAAFLLSIVLTGITAVLVRDRSRAMKLVEGASNELRRNKEFQAALQESERRWKLALEAAGHGVWDWDVQTDEVTCSELSKQMRGYSAENYPYRFFRDWGAGIHPEDLPQVLAAVHEHMEGKTPTFIFEYRASCKNGEWKWIITRGTVVERDGYGKPLRMLGTHTDIGERRAMQVALEEEKQFSDDIINSLPGNFYMLDANGSHVRWNKNTEKVTGYTAEEMAHIEAMQFFEGEDRVAVRDKLQEVFERGEGEIEAGLVSKNGKKTPYHFSARRTVIGGKPYLVGVGLDVSARKTAEEALRENEVRYREIFNNASYFIFTLDTAQRVTFAPPVLAQVTGYAVEEIVGAHIGKILTPESMVKAHHMMSLKLEGATAVTQYEIDLLHRDGHTIPIEVNTSLIYQQGKVIGVQGAGRDITERYRYEQSLRESEEKYRGLFESAGDFAYSTDLNWNFTAASDALLEATGYSRDEMVGSSVGKILTPENMELARKMTGAKLAGESQVTRYEMELTTKDGRQIPVEIVSTLVYKDGKPVRVQGIGRDISERKRAEKLLRRSERNYRELMEQAAEAIFVTDHEGQYCLEVNQAACEMLGYPREELLKVEVKNIFHPEEISREPIKFDEVRAGGTTYTRRRFRRKDGSYVPVELSSRMLSDGRLQALVRDISEWIEREAALREANIKAESASRAKSEFLANMSHEIRTPMNSVIGMARLALSRETNARQLDYLEKILMSGEHLLGIIDDILDFSKIEAGKLQIESADFDLRSVMDNLASLMSGRAAGKGLDFIVEIDTALPSKVRGDPLRLRQVLLNFADNAIKFTAQGEVRVSAKKVEDGDVGCSVRFEVHDTGIGMSAVEMAMLFRPFQQTDGSVTRKYGGTGLGLSISKRLVELMGGEAGVESEPGHGSTFWFQVRLDESRQETAPALERAVDRRDLQTAIRNSRILLAENNIFNQQVAREFLEIAGCVVHVAGDGAEALDLLRNEHFDCVLMDVQMPVMDGMEATRQIRANPAFAAMPVIAVTANAQEEERQRCMNAGMNDFITKPVRPEMLYAVLAKWLSRQMLPLSVPERRRNEMDAPQQAAAIDFAVLAELVGDDREKMRQLAHKFIHSTRQDMDKVEAALEQNDLAQLKEMGHHIKSPAAMMGAAGFAELCRALEMNTDDLNEARELVHQMQLLLVEIEGRIEAQFT